MTTNPRKSIKSALPLEPLSQECHYEYGRRIAATLKRDQSHPIRRERGLLKRIESIIAETKLIQAIPQTLLEQKLTMLGDY